MTTLNTIIEEEKKGTREEVRVKVQAVAGTNMHVSWKEIEEIINQSLTTAIQRAYEAGKADNAQENTPDTRCKDPLHDIKHAELGGLSYHEYEEKLDKSFTSFTPDTEWEKGWKFKLQELIAEYQHGRLALSCDVLTFVESLLSSRDTYWKERVRKEVGKALRELDIDDHNYLTARRAIAEVSGIPMMAITFNEHLKVIKEKLQTKP